MVLIFSENARVFVNSEIERIKKNYLKSNITSLSWEIIRKNVQKYSYIKCFTKNNFNQRSLII